MIEILKKGTKTKCTCKQCGCLFTYEEEDLKGTVGDFDPRGKGKYVICPQCESRINVGGVMR